MKPLPLKLQSGQIMEVDSSYAAVLTNIARSSEHPLKRPLASMRDLLGNSTVTAHYARHNSTSYGYIITETAGNTLFILDLAVRQSDTRRSIATQLLSKVMTDHGPGKRVVAWVPEVATPALCFFRDRGFHYGGRDAQHFFDPDAEVYQPGLKLTTERKCGVPKGPLVVSLHNRLSEYFEDTD